MLKVKNNESQKSVLRTKSWGQDDIGHTQEESTRGDRKAEKGI